MKRTKILLLTNGITLVFCIAIMMRYDVPQKIFLRIKTDHQPAGVPAHYEIRNALFSVYRSTGYDVVMLGDSITEGVEWNELLGESGIANRGIGGDTTQGMLDRLSDIYKLSPAVCFIMIGVNDILQETPVETIITNYKAILQNLLQNKITVVCSSTLYVSASYSVYWKIINGKIDAVNNRLADYCSKNNVAYLDVNSLLAVRDNDNGGGGYRLSDEFSYDGLHLNGLGYREWGGLIMAKIKSVW